MREEKAMVHVAPSGDTESGGRAALAMTVYPDKGPVRILCDEIGFEWDARLERQDVFVAFVRELVREIEHMRWIQTKVFEKGGQTAPSPASATVLGLALTMLEQADQRSLIVAAGAVHDASHELNPDEAYPTDHLIDMLSSCASAIRFGLESPCRSRHAASAAGHVFGKLYGLRMHDSRTPDWEKGWARSKLLSALVSLLPTDGVGYGPHVQRGGLNSHDIPTKDGSE